MDPRTFSCVPDLIKVYLSSFFLCFRLPGSSRSFVSASAVDDSSRSHPWKEHQGSKSKMPRGMFSCLPGVLEKGPFYPATIREPRAAGGQIPCARPNRSQSTEVMDQLPLVDSFHLLSKM